MQGWSSWSHLINGLDWWTGMMDWIVDWIVEENLKLQIKFLHYGRECWMSINGCLIKKKCSVFDRCWVNGETEDFSLWEAYLWYISIHKLSWPHYSEAVADTSQTTTKNYSLFPKLGRLKFNTILVRCCQWLMQHVFISWASMVYSHSVAPTIYWKPLYMLVCFYNRVRYDWDGLCIFTFTCVYHHVIHPTLFA